MLVLPDSDPYYRIISIDPGTDRLGVALLVLDLKNQQAFLDQVTTLVASKKIRHLPFTVDTMGERGARLQTHCESLIDIFDRVRPHCVISEAAYMGRFAQAFESLTECLGMMRYALACYDPSMILEMIDSPTVKNGLGVAGKKPKGMDAVVYKDLVKQAIIELNQLQVNPAIDLNSLDEHATDAIAVGCYKLRFASPNII